MAEEAKIYHVQNMVRRQGTRLHRARSAARHRFKLFIAGQRLLRNKKLPLTEEQFEREKERIQKLVLAGQIALFLPDGIRVTSLPDGRLVYTKPNGATKIGEPPKAEPKKAPPKAAAKPVEEEPEAAEPDDLTALPNVGPGRARKLESEGVTSFAGVSSLGASSLAALLNVPDEVAEEICRAAEEMKG